MQNNSPLKFILLPVGSHGDVHPFVAIGQALLARGHDVVMMTAEPFRGVAERHNLRFIATQTKEEYHTLTNHPDLWHPEKGLKVVFDNDLMSKYLPIVYNLIKQENVENRTVILGGTMAYVGRIAQEKLAIPHATLHLQPMSCISVSDPPVSSNGLDLRWLPKPIIRSLFWLGEKIYLDPVVAKPINSFRQTLGLPAVSRIMSRWGPSSLKVFGTFPNWFGAIQDGGEKFKHVGFISFDDANGRPTPEALKQFLRLSDHKNSVQRPVIFSFGSAMKQGKPYFEAAVQACLKLNIRGVLLAQAGDQIPGQLPEQIFHADYAPFSDVFPMASCIVHHGGIGTSAQALRAGVPQLIMPMAFDQADNAARLKKLGVGDVCFPKKFTVDNVAEKLKAILGHTNMQQTAKELSKKFNSSTLSENLNTICTELERLILLPANKE